MPGPVILRCDGGGQYGVGHVMRQLALADELRSRALPVQFVGSLEGAGWLGSLLAERGLSFRPAAHAPEALRDQLVGAAAAAVVLDGYHLPVTTGAELRAAGIPVLAMVDYSFGVEQSADLYVDQNLGAVADRFLPASARPAGSRVLAGISYALFRDDVLQRRRGEQREPSGASVPRVLAVFGGTDPYAAAPVVVPAVLATGEPMTITVVAATSTIAEQLRALLLADGQSLDVVAPTPDLAALAARADLIVSASGSSVWEFLCMGIPTALVCVVDNQVEGYNAVTDLGVAAGLGHLADFDADRATTTIRGLLDSAPDRERLRRAGQQLVDGDGRIRVADALTALM